MKNNKNTKGITLVALVVTIIIMLILVAITISLAVNGGLFEFAGKAVGETQNAIDNEIEQTDGKVQVNGVWYNSIDTYLEETTPTVTWYYCVSKTDSTESDTETNYVTCGATGDNGDVKIYEIGEEISYSPTTVDANKINELYTMLSKYSGYSGENYSTDYPITQEQDLRWLVYDVKNGKLRIISDTPTTTTVYLYGAKGYNNAVYLIDTVCKELYSGTNATAENIKIEDIEEKLSYDYTAYTNYGGTPYTYENVSFPAIHKNESGAYKDIESSTQDELIDESSTTGTITPKSSFWYKKMAATDFNNEKYYTLLINNGSNYAAYWMSSRVVTCYANTARFSVHCITSGMVGDQAPFTSNDASNSVSSSLRPLVSISYSI